MDGKRRATSAGCADNASRMTQTNKPESKKTGDGSPQALIHASNEIRSLRNYTSARVALGRSGSSIVTADILDFQLAHAQARDAVKAEFDVEHFAQRVRHEVPALEEFSIPVLTLNSAAPDRENYIRRPDLGRVLAKESAAFLKPSPCDVIFVIADGLSAVAPERNAIPLLDAVLPMFFQSGWTSGPVCVVKNARVAIGDQIGSLLRASLSVVLIGERPGLSSHDSLGAYITWQPQPGRTDAERNCISNIRNRRLEPCCCGAALVLVSK